MHSLNAAAQRVPAMQMTDITRVRGKICIVSVHKKTTRSELKRSEFQKNRQWLEQEYIRKKNSEELQNLQKRIRNRT